MLMWRRDDSRPLSLAELAMMKIRNPLGGRFGYGVGIGFASTLTFVDSQVEI